MKLASIAFLLSSAVASAHRNETEVQQQPCGAQFMAVDSHCAHDRSGMDECMDECFSRSMAERGVLEMNEMPSCPVLTSTLCACTRQCTSKLDDGCVDAMIKTLECNLVNEFGCAGHSCPKPSFGLTGKGFGAMRAAAARLRKPPQV